jgi:hypothetical protein
MSFQFGAIQGLDDLRRRMDTLTSMRGLEGDLEDEGDAVVKEAQDYPPERPGQRYARSFLLRNSWRRADARRQGDRVTVDVTNAAPHGPSVMGDEQAEIHKGRWKRLRVIGEGRRAAVRARTQAWALRIWRGG